MNFPMPCPRCQAPLTVTLADAGRQITCGNCGQPIIIPHAMAAGPPPMMAPMPMPMAPPPSGGGSGWMVLGIVVAAILLICGGGGVGAFFWLFGPAVNTARTAAVRLEAQNNARQLMMGILNHESSYNMFPPQATCDPSGKPLLSWRVKALEFLDSKLLYDQFHHDEPWDSPHNRSLIHQMPAIYHSPGVQLPSGHTCWQAVIGPRSLIAGQNPVQKGLAPGRGVSSSRVEDGLSNTIAIVEVDPDRAVTWTKPDDFEFDQNSPLRGLGSMRPGGFIVGFGDGSVRSLPTTIDPETLRNLFDRGDGNPVTLP